MVKRLYLMATGIALSMSAMAQSEKHSHVTFGMEFATEMQTDFRAVNWVNLLHLSAEADLGKGFAFEVGSYSVAKTREERLLDDLQVFSNIEDENLPLAFSVLGLRWQRGGSELFLGVRNMNEDYFISPLTSLFTNSSCGIFPTISANYDIANYPLASLGIGFKQTWRDWLFQASVYNGQGYNGFKSSDNPFLCRPKRDGVFGITSANYTRGDSRYEVGCALHVVGSDAGCAPWANVEQRLTDRFHLLAQGSVNFAAESECKHYEAIGLVAQLGKTETGLTINHAAFSEAHEYAAELTSQIPLNQNLTLQPAIHLIRTGHDTNCAALLRLTYNL